METETIGKKFLCFPIIFQIVCFHLLQCAPEIIDIPAEYHAESALRHRPCAVAFKLVHIEHCRGSACQILHHRQLGQPVHIISRKLCLSRKHFFKQPFLKLHIVRVGTQESHR